MRKLRNVIAVEARRLYFLRTAYAVKVTFGIVGLLPIFDLRVAFRNFDCRVPWAEDWALRDVTRRVGG